MAQKEEKILKDWQDYVNDYSTKLSVLKTETDAIINSPTATATEKQNAQRDYELQKAHLEELQTKLSSLQTYYAQHGELPDDVTFDGGKLGSFRYKTAVDSDWFTGYARNLPPGSVYISAQHFSLVIEAWGTGGTWVAYDGTGNPNWFGIWNEGYVSWAGYHAYDQKNYMSEINYDSGSWSSHTFLGCTVSTSLADDVIPQGTAALSHTFTNGIIIEMPSDTVPTDSPWDYYNDDIVPNLEDPDNNIYPGGYEPPSPGDDPEDGPVEEDPPDKTDWGAPELPYTGGFDTSNSFCNYAAFTKIGINSLRIKLWDQPDDFWDALSMVKSNAANWLDYFVNIRAYPYRIDMDDTLNRYLYIGRGGEIDMGGTGSEQFQYKVPTLVRVVSWTWEKDAISKHYNNFLDFAPYTKAEIYLPFSGTWEINPTWLYHTELVLSLAIDITDGSGTWQLMAYRDTESAIVLRKQCKVGIELPISGNDAMSQSSAIVNATLTTAQHTVDNVKTIASGVSSIAKSKGKKETLKNVGSLLEEAPNMVIQGLSDSVNMAFASKEKPSYSGGSTGAAAARLNIVPSIKVHRPIAKNPDTFGHTVGNLVNKASRLEKLTGFTTCRNVDMSNVPQATDKEKAELKRILEDGFYA